MLSLCEYYAEDGLGPDHFVPWYIVRGIKKDKRDLRGYRRVRVDGRWESIEKGSEDVALRWAGERMAKAIAKHLPDESIAIVPIPGSKETSPALVSAGRGFALANATVDAYREGDAIAVPLLQWKKPKPRAHDEGGTRDPDALEKLLMAKTYHRASIGDRTIVLMDDVVTSGGSMLACRKFLRGLQHRYKLADVGYAAARTVHVKGEPLAYKLEALPRPDDRPSVRT